MKDSFIMRLAYKEQIETLTDEQSGKLFKAILRYATGEPLPEMDAVTSMCFLFIRQQLDKDSDAYESKCQQNARNVRKRWEKDTTVYDRINSDTKPYEEVQPVKGRIDSYSDNDSDNDNDLKKEPPKGGKKESVRFHPPTPEEVREYVNSKGYNVDSTRFCDFYASKGWKVGSSPMKDWKAAVRNWARSERQGKATKPVFESKTDLDALIAGGFYQ